MAIHEEKKVLSADEVGQVSGGGKAHNHPFKPPVRPKPGELFDESKPWEVVDDADGHVVGRYATKEEALEMAKSKAQSSKEITKDELMNFRKTRFPFFR